MHPASRPRSRALALAATILACAAGSGVRPAIADPVHGFVEHWNAGTTSGWTGGDNYSNPGTGGVLGANDGYLLFSTPGPSPFFTLNLGTTNSDATYTGNWVAAGITRVQFWLNDVGTPNPMEIHFALGAANNFWQYDTGFVPPAGTWAPFVVDLTGGPTGWTQIINTAVPPGTFSEALQSVGKVLIRHDKAPYVQSPDTITADVGLDELALLAAGDVGVPPPGAATSRAVALSAPYPNPAHGAVTLAVRSFDESPVHIEIIDAAGRLVRHDLLWAVSPGLHLWTWDGRTDPGPMARAGSYRARAYSIAGGTSRPFVWLGSR